MDLPAVGVRALFPPNTKLSLQQNRFYSAELSDKTKITFELKDYDGGGRREWFQKNYYYARFFQFVNYSANNHSGYLAYEKEPKNQLSFFYFFAKNNSQMLVVYSTGKDLSKFKAFINSLTSYTAQDISIQPYPLLDEMHRVSPERKTVWESSNLGVKITAPVWTEYRTVQDRDANGRVVYSDWTRIYSKVQEADTSYFFQPVKSVNVYGTFSEVTLLILPPQFSTYSFSQVVTELLLPAGFCTTEWKTDLSKCNYADSFCYTKDQVLSSLRLNNTASYGGIKAQLRGMDKSFSDKNDCRADSRWLYQAENGTYFFSANLSFNIGDARLELIK